MAKKYGGAGHRNPDRTAYDGHVRPNTCRPCPRDFREVYLDIGWDGITEHYRTNWRVICRWIDECGGLELIADRAAVVKERGARVFNHVQHVAGWTAEKLRARG